MLEESSSNELNQNSFSDLEREACKKDRRLGYPPAGQTKLKFNGCVVTAGLLCTQRSQCLFQTSGMLSSELGQWVNDNTIHYMPRALTEKDVFLANGLPPFPLQISLNI
jgi:hypothetical protein